MKFFSIIFLLMLVTFSSQARWSDALPILEPGDVTIIRDTARIKMSGKPVGTILKWKNKKGGSTGSVELLDRFQRDGRECRTNKHIIQPRSQPATRLVITICLGADGAWDTSQARTK